MRSHQRMAFERLRQREMRGRLVLAEIRRLEQLLDQDHFGAAGGGLAHSFSARAMLASRSQLQANCVAATVIWLIGSMLLISGGVAATP